MSADNFLDVRILGREYRVTCTSEEEEALLSAVTLVDGKMREIAQQTRNTMAERIAVMAALNIAHEHLSGQRDKSREAGLATSEAKRRMIDMEARLDAVLVPTPPAKS